MPLSTGFLGKLGTLRGAPKGTSPCWGSLLLVLLFGFPSSGFSSQKPVVRVGSKSFTESYILAEIIARIIEESGEAEVERKMGLGGTGITHRALSSGDIDLYPEYTGTLSQAILKDSSLESVADIRRRLRGSGLTISDSIGFNNTYALAVREELAERLGLDSVSDLKKHPEMRAAFSSGFTDRDDGWPGLREHYDLRFSEVRVIEHALSYAALAQAKVDVIDIYSTDGKLESLDLHILLDDLGFFPDYEAVMFVREECIGRFPHTWQRLEEALVNQIDDREMSRLNALADLEGKSLAQVSAVFLKKELPSDGRTDTVWKEVFALTLDHLYLVALSLGLGALVGIPLGLVAARFKKLGQIELMSVGVLQTIPSLALLCFMIPLFGIGKIPSLVALFLYALLPIVRNTYTGMISLDRQLLEIAGVLGLNWWQRLLRIELPLSSVNILAGIKTSAVLTVGTATLAAFIGGGGYGTLIVRGLALDDMSITLAGAVPAAVMALVIHALFEVLDRILIPRGLRKDFAYST
ncbi:MAG: glycine betaine ABC transporter substrate-binding protein [Acidobacteriota bacterium]